MTTRRFRDRERGQILVIVAGGAVTLLLLLGLVLDVGVAFVNRRDGQNAADLMSIAGAKFLADEVRNLDPPGRIFAALDRTARDNGCLSSAGVPCTWRAWFVRPGSGGPADRGRIRNNSGVPGNAIGVRVEVLREPRTFIVGLANLQKWEVGTQATAIAERPEGGPAGQVLPIGIWHDDAGSGSTGPFLPGQVYDFGMGTTAPYRFSFVSWSGAIGEASLRGSLCDPDNPPLRVGQPYVDNPVLPERVEDCLGQWSDSRQPVLVAICEVPDDPDDDCVIETFGAFVVMPRDTSVKDSIRGYFVDSYAYVNEPAGGGDQPDEGDTTYYIGLVR